MKEASLVCKRRDTLAVAGAGNTHLPLEVVTGLDIEQEEGLQGWGSQSERGRGALVELPLETRIHFGNVRSEERGEGVLYGVG